MSLGWYESGYHSSKDEYVVDDSVSLVSEPSVRTSVRSLRSSSGIIERGSHSVGEVSQQFPQACSEGSPQRSCGRKIDGMLSWRLSRCAVTMSTLKRTDTESDACMATVRKRRGRWVADFRDQNKRRHIETAIETPLLPAWLGPIRGDCRNNTNGQIAN